MESQYALILDTTDCHNIIGVHPSKFKLILMCLDDGLCEELNINWYNRNRLRRTVDCTCGRRFILNEIRDITYDDPNVCAQFRVSGDVAVVCEKIKFSGKFLNETVEFQTNNHGQWKMRKNKYRRMRLNDLLAPSSSVPRTDVPEDQDDHDEEAAIPRARNLRLKLIEIK